MPGDRRGTARCATVRVMALRASTTLDRRRSPIVTITMNRPDRRNALSLDHLRELIDAFRAVGDSDALGIVLAANGPVFSAGHDFADMAGADLDAMRTLLQTCTDLMLLIQDLSPGRGRPGARPGHRGRLPARGQLRPGRGRRVGRRSRRPGGKAGWFCTTPMVAIGRTMGRKRALELALTGDAIDAATAARLGPGQPRGARRRARCRGRRPASAGPRGAAPSSKATGQAGLLHPDRHGPAPGLRLRRRGHGRRQPDPRRQGERRRLPREAQAQPTSATRPRCGASRASWSPCSSG